MKKTKMKKTIDLNKLSFEELQKQVKELQQQKEKTTINKVGVWETGQNYVIRTVTMIQVGKLVNVTDNELVLENASWIADTGRWFDFLKDGTYKECEPFIDFVIVGRGSIIDATIWSHTLPNKQK